MSVSISKLTMFAFVICVVVWSVTELWAKEESKPAVENVADDAFAGKIVLLEVDRSNAVESKSNSVVIPRSV